MPPNDRVRVVAAATAEPVKVDPVDPPPPAAIDDAGRHEPVEDDYSDPNLAPPGKWRRRNLFDLDFTKRSRR